MKEQQENFEHCLSKANNDFTIKTKSDLIHLVNEWGFLPFFMNEIEGFSIEEHVNSDIWFTDNPGPWEWKGPVIRETSLAWMINKKSYIVPIPGSRKIERIRENGGRLILY